MEKTLQGSVKKIDGRTTKQRVIVAVDGELVHIHTGVWKKNEFTNEISVVVSKEELLNILNNG